MHGGNRMVLGFNQRGPAVRGPAAGRSAARFALAGLAAAALLIGSTWSAPLRAAEGDGGDVATPPAAAPGAAANERMLADFNQDGGVFKGAVVESVKELGGKAAKVTADGALKTIDPGHDWTDYTYLRFEVFNPNPAPVVLDLCLKDGDAPQGYYSWINRYTSVSPGKHTLEYQISALHRGEGSPKDGLDPRPFKWGQLEFAMIAGGKQPVYVSAVRLVKDVPKLFPGLHAFDFGPKVGGVGFLGWTEVTPDLAYTPQAGFGWVGGAPPYARHRSHPADELVGDWISGENITFQVDLPDGDYRGLVLMEDPGEWELYQNFTDRSLAVNGAKVVDETENGAQFLDRYFHFAETEDHPGDNIWDRYVAWRYPLRKIEFKVTDGKAVFNLRSSGQYAGTWNALAIWPADKQKEAQKFLADLEARRRKSFAGAWTERLPVKQPLGAGLAAANQAQGYVAFQRGLGVDVNYFDAPADAIETQLNGDLAAARGERLSWQFAIHALADLNGLSLQAGDLKSADGTVFPAAAVQCGYVNFKFKRIGFGGQGQYGVVPFIVKPFTAADPATDALAGTARQFWVTVTVPADQKPGTYVGTLTLKAAGKSDRALPLRLTVVDATLPDADVGLGFFGYGTAPYFAYFPENQARVDEDKKRMLVDLRAHGVTFYSVSGVKFEGFHAGAARWDVSQAAAEFAAAKAAGFSTIEVLADGNATLDAIALNPDAAAKKFGFADGAAILKASFGSVDAACAAQGLPAPMFSFGDEPGTKPVMARLSVIYGNVRKAGALGEISYSVMPLTEPLLDLLGVSSLNHASLADIQRALKGGNRVLLNNQGRNRFAFGWYMWKARAAGVEATQQFIYNGPSVDPYNPFDGIEDEESMVYPDRQGMLRPRVDYERVAQGITDYRLLLMVKNAAAAGDAKAQAAWTAVSKQLAAVKFEETGRDRRPQVTDADLDAANQVLLGVAPAR